MLEPFVLPPIRLESLKAAKFTISPVEPADIEAIVLLAEECGLSPWTPRDYREEAKRTDSILMRLTDDSGNLAGFLVGRRVPGNSADGRLDAEIYNIGIRRSMQRNGAGSVLLREFLKRCSEHEVVNVWLDVRTSNAGAIAFYRSFGFEEFTIRNSFYTDPVEDGMVMKLELTGRIY